MKKKAYITPALCIVKTHLSSIIATSIPIDPEQSGGGILTKESSDWDIWGNGSDEDYDDEY